VYGQNEVYLDFLYMPSTEKMNFKLWKRDKSPTRILAIRFQAMGDMVITLPYLCALSQKYPNAQIDFLTREEVASISRSLDFFNQVYAIKGGRNPKLILLFGLFMVPILLLRRYDVVIDLQKNRVSRWVRWLLNPNAWSEFDRYSPISAGERTRLTIEAVGLGNVQPLGHFKFKDHTIGSKILQEKGWSNTSEWIVLNPAGAFITRNWPIENYVAFARLWLSKKNPDARFVLLGDGRITGKAAFLQTELGDKIINLLGLTTPAEAFAILQKMKFVLSEDSGLMHMAWVSGILTLALFGSSRSDWSAPQGSHTRCLNSSDLTCGACMSENCFWGDVHCLTRFSPERVFEEATQLLVSI
jgi:ADP-heptose:LPS heptosyltransferase